eukprot:CAMPEP_0170407822 /NCGR_PEP_ID=MMETSP0117_2-20130122/28455_1 /TAXON_ID=400756 /ORGANISM="Durinskia baltica, Strain CSIRO CS-38" /LENGTH=219 /DNA_ID=CAMNT_0010665101 /DNA_START=68 /DNA_END=724 /DNA_ORIENTATION=+
MPGARPAHGASPLRRGTDAILGARRPRQEDLTLGIDGTPRDDPALVLALEVERDLVHLALLPLELESPPRGAVVGAEDEGGAAWVSWRLRIEGAPLVLVHQDRELLEVPLHDHADPVDVGPVRVRLHRGGPVAPRARHEEGALCLAGAEAARPRGGREGRHGDAAVGHLEADPEGFVLGARDGPTPGLAEVIRAANGHARPVCQVLRRVDELLGVRIPR